MSRYTPGPWVYKRESDGRDWLIRPAKAIEEFGTESHHAPIARVTMQGNDFHHANAHLIAAAPELLIVAKYALGLGTHAKTDIENAILEAKEKEEALIRIQSFIEVTREVIAKAEGREE